MYQPFFPTTEFAWGFLVILGAILVVAAYIDQKRMVIPKWVTLGLLALGLVGGIARGAWLGGEEQKIWIFDTGNPLLGGMDGLLFSLAGAVVGFTLLFVLWILGTCGGGDVKLFCALGAWLGPKYIIYVLIVSLLVLFLVVPIKMLLFGIDKNARQASGLQSPNKGKQGRPAPRPKVRISYSLPVAVATLAVLLWVFRGELRLVSEGPQSGKAVADVR